MSTYKDAGVDISKGEDAVQRIKAHVEATHTDKVLKGIGAFAGAFDASALKGMQEPVLLSSIDSVGTKTLIATETGNWEGIGRDMVGHSANDLVCQGAAPLFFLDYLASAELSPDITEQIVKGMSDACTEIDCVLIGGELAEMPQIYHTGAHDVVGAMVGVVEKSKMITGESITEGDVLIALPSNGLHTNGYSLARKVLEGSIAEHADALLQPHTQYSTIVRKLHDEVGLKGVAHITGGGIRGNLSRILPEGLGAEIQKSAIQTPDIFTIIQEKGGISDDAMYEAMNMGVGMILVVGTESAETILSSAEGAAQIGKVIAGSDIQIS